jgi:hypothetical protein
MFKICCTTLKYTFEYNSVGVTTQYIFRGIIDTVALRRKDQYATSRACVFTCQVGITAVLCGPADSDQDLLTFTARAGGNRK